MDISSLLLDLYGRIPTLAREAVKEADPEQLCTPPAPGANTVAWLIWHLSRVQDHHVAELVGEEQVWLTGDWPRAFGLELDPSNTGYGHTPDEVLSVRPERTEVLLEYLAAVDGRTRTMLQHLTPTELDRVVDRRWDPPVTLGVRLVSVADDCLQHAGQAAYARGLVGF